MLAGLAIDEKIITPWNTNWLMTLVNVPYVDAFFLGNTCLQICTVHLIVFHTYI